MTEQERDEPRAPRHYEEKFADDAGSADDGGASLSKEQVEGRGWPEQWARVQRWHEELRLTYEGRTPEQGGTDWARDVALGFFMFAFHLADWIDKGVPPREHEQSAKNFMHNDERGLPLLWCRDLANATKHLVLDSKWYPPMARDTDMSRTDLTINFDEGRVPHRFTVTATICGKKQERDALFLADACMDAWRVFLAGRGLVTG